MDIDIAITHLNELFFLHKYDECVLFLNRLNHKTIKFMIKNVSIDIYLSRLPYTIEIFDALYSKMFISEPETFPTRYLAPERLIDKMILYFSVLDNQMKLEPIDGFKIINSFENCIRIITYVQPNLYSRLLYFKYTIDKCLVKLEQKDFLQLNSVLNIISPGFSQISFGQVNKKSDKKKKSTSESALVVLSASNIELCSHLKYEISKTINCCNMASEKLTGYVKNIKNEKLFKDASSFLKQQRAKADKKDKTTTSNCQQDTQKTICCQDYVQHRLFLNKSLLNTIESLINEIKLNKIVENLGEKIKLDKEILLIYSHIKREEKYLNSYEPLQPLFRRYSLGYERVIQIWRKKCCADTLISLSTNLNQMFSSNINPHDLSSNYQLQSSYNDFNESQKIMSINESVIIPNQSNSLSIPDAKCDIEKSLSGMCMFFKYWERQYSFYLKISILTFG
jgi:hypothetical protein